MCREVVSAVKIEKGSEQILTGVGHHTSLFTDAGLPTDRDGWITAQSDFDKGPGEFHIETRGVVSSRAIEKISGFYKDICSSADKFVAFVRDKGWDNAFLGILTPDAQAIYNSVFESLSTAFDEVSSTTVDIDTDGVTGTLTIDVNTDAIREKVLAKTMVEVFGGLFASGMNRVNAWKQLN